MASRLLLEDGVSFLLLEDGTSKLRIDPVDATLLYPRSTVTLSTGTDANSSDMLRQYTAGTFYYVELVDGGSDIPITDTVNTGIGWYSERVTTLTTLTTLVFRHKAFIDVPTAGTLRIRVWRQGADPAHQQTLIADYLGGTIQSGALQEWDLPLIGGSVVLAPGERLVLRITGEPLSGSTMALAEISVGMDDVILMTEPAIPMQSNVRRFYLQRTTNYGVGTFYDMTETPVTQTPATGVVNTFAGSSGEAQWTRTAGGTVLEWVSPRFPDSWYFDNVTVMSGGSPFVIARAHGLIYAIESNAAANATIRARFYRRRDTTEIECGVSTDQSELPLAYPSTENVKTDGIGSGVTPIDFQPDDRLVLRAYITPRGTMVSGHTATLQYDGTSFQSYVDIFETGMGPMKAESDPATPARITGGDTMGGVGN